MLKMTNVNASYGSSQVLFNVNFHIEKGELVTIIGSNGAGKSTILKILCGWLKPTSGEVLFDEQIINNLPTQEFARRGIAVSPEGRRVFPQMTVLENLEMGAYTRNKSEKAQELEAVYDLFPRLKERKSQLGGCLSGGEQQMLAIGRAMMSKPKLLLLDEPSLGLSPVMVDTMLDAIKVINNDGVTICLVEQNAQLALQMADRAYALETGCIVMEGTGEQLLNDENVKNVYLGL